MLEVAEPLDPADAATNNEGAIAPDDTPPVDEFDTDTGLDSERIVLLENHDGRETNPEADSDNDLDLENGTNPSDQ